MRESYQRFWFVVIEKQLAGHVVKLFAEQGLIRLGPCRLARESVKPLLCRCPNAGLMLKAVLWVFGLDDWECRVPPSKFSRDSAIDDRVGHVRDGACSPMDELVGVAIGESDQGRRGELVLCK